MEKAYAVKGSKKPLRGEVKISGHKNAAGPILAATILTKKPCVIDNLPRISDILNLIGMLEQIGAEVKWLNPHKIKISTRNIDVKKIPADLFRKMRVSVLLIGPLLSRFKKFKVPHPGGDKIGLRPISSHLEALKEFGVQIKKLPGFYVFEAPEKRRGKRIVLKEFSVTATENIMMLASGVKGKSIIETAACEPQVQDLGKFLNKMGAKRKNQRCRHSYC